MSHRKQALLMELSSFQTEFETSDLKVTHGRAQLKIDSEPAVHAVREWFDSKFPGVQAHFPDEGEADKDVGEQLVKAVKPAVFGTSLNHVDCRLDLAALPCFRLHFIGTRKLVILRMLDLQDYLAEKGPSDMPVRTRTIFTWLREASSADIQELLDSGRPAWWATVGPNEAVWRPTAVIAFEQTVGLTDCIGVRFGCFVEGDAKSMKGLSAYVSELDALGSPATATHDALKYLKEIASQEGEKGD